MATRNPKDRANPTPPLPLLPLQLHPLRDTLVWAAGRFVFAYNLSQNAFELSRSDHQHCDVVRSLASRADISNGSTCWASGGDDKRVAIWSEKNGAWSPGTKIVHTKKVVGLLFDADGRVLFGDRFGDVHRWNRREGDPVEFLLGHLAIITAMCFTSDGRFLITADNSEKIRVNLYPQVAVIHTFCLGHTGQITSLAPVGTSQLCSSAADGTLRLWSLETGSQLAVKEVGSPVICLATNDSKLVAVVADKGLYRGRAYQSSLDLEPTSLVVSEECPQAACFVSDEVCWIDHCGHLRCGGTNAFAGEDVGPCIVALSKYANYLDGGGDGEAMDDS
jgi:WD40 repeat protein